MVQSCPTEALCIASVGPGPPVYGSKFCCSSEDTPGWGSHSQLGLSADCSFVAGALLTPGEHAFMAGAHRKAAVLRSPTSMRCQQGNSGLMHLNLLPRSLNSTRDPHSLTSPSDRRQCAFHRKLGLRSTIRTTKSLNGRGSIWV